MTKKTHTIVAALIAAAFTTDASAGQPAVKSGTSGETTSNLTGYLETSWTSNYVFQGVKLDSNPTFVPKLGVQYALFEGGSLQASVEQAVGTQGSAWYRSQYNVGLSLDIGRVTVTPGYQVIAWPSREGNNTQAITGRLEFNDEGLTPVALRPHFLINSNVDPRGGTYYEVGVTPTKNFGKLNVAFPVAIGVGAQGYYTGSENTAGSFTSAGVALSYPVTDRLSFKGASTYFATEKSVGNDSNRFVSTSVGVAVSF